MCDHGFSVLANLEQILMTTTTSLRKTVTLTAKDDGFVYIGNSPLRLPPKEQATLHLLLRRSPGVVSKDEFAEHVWSGRGMSDESLAHCVHRVRHLLREASADAQVESLYGRGYRLKFGPVEPTMHIAHQRLLSVARAPPRMTEALIFARQLSSQRTPASLAQAALILRDIILEAPDFAPARVALAECLAGGNTWAVNIDVASIEEGLQHLEVAERSMPNVTGLHSARAYLLDRAWRFREARNASEKAILDNPYDPDTNFHYGWHLLATGRAEAACESLRQAIGLHPYSVLLRFTLARAFTHTGNFDAAMCEAQAAYQLAPGNEMAELMLTGLRAWLQPNDEVVETARRLASSSNMILLAPSVLSYSLARTGRRQEAASVIENDSDRIGSNAATNAFHVSTLLELDRFDDAMILMQCAFDARCGMLPVMLREPANAKLKSHSSYAALFEQVFVDM